MPQLAEALLNVPKDCFLTPSGLIFRCDKFIDCHESQLSCKSDYCLDFQSFHSETWQLEMSALDSRRNRPLLVGKRTVTYLLP